MAYDIQITPKRFSWKKQLTTDAINMSGRLRQVVINKRKLVVIPVNTISEMNHLDPKQAVEGAVVSL